MLVTVLQLLCVYSRNEQIKILRIIIARFLTVEEKQLQIMKGGRFRIGDTYTTMADSCQCMAKTTTIL